MANTNSSATGWSATASDFNLLLNADPTHLTQWLGAAAANNQTLAGFRTASGGDANSIQGDPQFIAPDDLHIRFASPASNAGTPVAGVTTDFDGDTRSATTPDIGADEIDAPPTITAIGVTRKAGDAGSTSAIATVADAEDAENALAVLVNGAASATVNDVTVSGLAVDAAGNVTANVVAACSATDAAFTLRVTDSVAQFAEATLNVTVTPNTAPVLSYAATSVLFGQSGTINPATGPSDSGSIATIAVQSPGTFVGTLSADNGTGVVTYGNAAPVGAHTVTVRATDNCGATTDAALAITVGQGATTTTITSDSPDPSLVGQNVTVAFTVAPVAPATGTPSGNVTVSDGVASCSATVAAGQCTLTLNTSGLRTLAATYAGDANFTGSSDTESHVVGDQADLSVSKTSSLALIGSGLIQYTIVVSNAGPSGVVGATVADTLPAGLSGATWTCAGTFGATCTASGSGDINDSVNLPSNSSVVYSLTASVALPFAGATNTATVSVPSGVVDPDTTNNASSVTDLGALIFGDGFEDVVFTTGRPATPGTSDRVAVSAAALRDAARDLTPRIVTSVDIGTQRVWLLARMFDGVVQAQIVTRDGARWSASGWTAADPTRALALAWTVDRNGVIAVVVTGS